MIGVIIAAGFGSRLWSVSSKIPKTLLPFGGGTILSTIITQLRDAGVDRLVIVVGYNQGFIREYLSTLDTETPIEIIENLEWEEVMPFLCTRLKNM
jgi:glucose-1-phosphate thymidylyltransferase